MLDQAQDQVGRRYRGLDPQQPEVVVVARVVDARDDAVTEVLLLGDLAHKHVVLVVPGHRDHHIGSLDARPLEHPQLRRVAVLSGVLEFLLQGEVALAPGLDHGHLVTLADQLARQVSSHLTAACDDRVHG